MKILNDDFGTEIRIISAGRPQANGQAESFVKSLKNKMYALMAEGGYHCIPSTWDQTLLHRALQIIRSDPSIATGYSPMELIMGRKPKWPIEIDRADIDFSGAELTAPLVDALGKIHDNAFGIAARNIAKEQQRYSRASEEFATVSPPFFLKI